MAGRDQVLVAVNGVFVPLETVVREGDDAAFFPPVSGG
jgi:molybdopterin converting factor small subunit